MTRTALVVLGVASLCAIDASAQKATESFTATATVRRGASSASAPVRVSITRLATEAERAAAKKALTDGGTSGLRKLLTGWQDAGVIELGERKTPIKFAAERPTPGGRLLTVVTQEPILFLGAGMPAAKPREGYEVAIGILEVKDNGPGIGDLSPAAKVAFDEHGALVTEDYGATVIWLNNVARAK